LFATSTEQLGSRSSNASPTPINVASMLALPACGRAAGGCLAGIAGSSTIRHVRLYEKTAGMRISHTEKAGAARNQPDGAAKTHSGAA
jgi:hypothetical protein